ncbi:non-specific lipid-transfer protein-like protein [Tanacetum coccineum]
MACTLMKIACVMVACMVVFAPHANAITCGVRYVLFGGIGGIKGVKPALASSLPGKCGVSIPYKISPSTDCSKKLHIEERLEALKKIGYEPLYLKSKPLVLHHLLPLTTSLSANIFKSIEKYVKTCSEHDAAAPIVGLW